MLGEVAGSAEGSEAMGRRRRRGQRPSQGGAGRASREGTVSAAERAPSQVAGRRRARFQGGAEGERRHMLRRASMQGGADPMMPFFI